MGKPWGEANIHKPVLLREVLEYLGCSEGKVYVDGTVGEGGHTEQILEKTSPTGKVVGIDLDQQILERAGDRLKKFGPRIHLVRDNYKNIKEILTEREILQIDGFLVDLGISLFHFQSQERGFSFHLDAPLDMRLDQRSSVTAAKIINRSAEKELAQILWQFGEERWGRRIARAICVRRQKARILSTRQLAEIAASAIPAKFRSKRIHPATKTFQALRIAVNQELRGLDQALIDVADVLKPGARMCVISFHSLEDRIVKKTFRKLSHVKQSDDLYGLRGPKIKILTPKPIVPTEEEIRDNFRARSAKLRVAEKC